MTKQRPKPPQKNRLQFGKKEPSSFKERNAEPKKVKELNRTDRINLLRAIGNYEVKNSYVENDSVSRLELGELFGVSMDNKGYE